MDKFDQYKRLLRLGIAGMEIILEAAFLRMSGMCFTMAEK